MKRTSTILFITLSICSMIALGASEGSTTQPATNVVDGRILSPMYVMLSPLDTAALPQIPIKKTSGNFVSKTLDHDLTWSHTLHSLQNHDFSDKSIHRMMQKMHRYTHRHYVAIPCAYWSQSPNGDSLLVSGKVYLPKNRKLNGIIIANHHTITSDIEAPSSALSTESIFTMKGYAVIMPDYVGYGVSRNEVHPYLHWHSAARTAIDLLDCMPMLLGYYGYTYPTDIVVEGYSQGAAVALGVVRMIEENINAGDTTWTIRKLYAGAGPYDPAATYIYSIEHDTMGIPAAIPLIVMGLDNAYNLGFEKEDFFLEPLLSHYEEWVLSKEFTVTEINEKIGSMQISKIMTPESLNANLPSSELLYKALTWNSNVEYDLQSPAYFLHSVSDEVVPLINSYNLQANLPDTSFVEFEYGNYGSHMAASIPFFQHIYQEL